MKMYSKNIRNLKELEREKRRLVKLRKELEQDEIFTLNGIINNISKPKQQDTSNSGFAKASGIGGLFSLSGPIAGLVIDIVKDTILSKPKVTENSSLSGNAMLQKGASILKDAAKEMLGGYLKWKALELTYKGITVIVKRQKEKKTKKVAKEDAADF